MCGAKHASRSLAFAPSTPARRVLGCGETLSTSTSMDVTQLVLGATGTSGLEDTVDPLYVLKEAAL